MLVLFGLDPTASEYVLPTLSTSHLVESVVSDSSGALHQDDSGLVPAASASPVSMGGVGLGGGLEVPLDGPVSDVSKLVSVAERTASPLHVGGPSAPGSDEGAELALLESVLSGAVVLVHVVVLTEGDDGEEGGDDGESHVKVFWLEY